MRTITFLQPNRLTIGFGCVAECISYVQGLNRPAVHIISSPSLWTTMTEIGSSLIGSGCIVSIDAGINAEPTISMFEQAVAKARDAKAACVLGIGGGSVLDIAKLVAASTGLDALTHCIEAYTNKFAHPLVDVYALQGISLCHQFLARAVRQPDDLEAREGMSLASLYGGLCLGPVNTAAVHALAYPLGGEFHVPHGLSNALLLSHVFRFNAQATPDRHAAVAIAMGVRPSADALDTAYLGADRLKQLATDCGVLTDLSRYKVDLSAIPGMAKSAMTVTRLLKNNPRDIDEAACLKIYSECFQEQ